MYGQQQTINLGGGLYDSTGDILAAEKRRNDRLKQAKQVNANAEALAQIQAGMAAIGRVGDTKTPSPQPSTVAATVDQLVVENKALKAVNFELQTRCIALHTEIVKLKTGIK